MQFANRFLPRAERDFYSLQGEGPEPKSVRVAQRDKLASTVVLEATQLMKRLPGRSVAIISADIDQIATALRRAGRSTQPDGLHLWSGPDGVIRLLNHDQARGLEFDGVVAVVEPANFPSTEGAVGSLSASLSRANKELVVVNHKALPSALRES